MKKLLGTTLTSAILLAAGLCLVINPGAFMNTICYIAGAVAVIIAAIKFVSAYKKNSISSEAPMCIILLILGAVLIFLQSSIISIFPLIIGICFLCNGLLKLKSAFAFKSVSGDVYKKLLISSLIGIAFALLIIILANFIGDIIYRLIGVLLIYNSAGNVFEGLVSRQKNEKKNEKSAVEAEAVETEEKKD